MSQIHSPGEAYNREDALAPATAKQSLEYLAQLPNAVSRKWWIALFVLHASILIVFVTQSNLFGQSVDILAGKSVPVFGSGNEAFALALATACICLILEQCGRALSDLMIGRKLRTASIDLRRKCLNAVMNAPVPEIMKLGTGNVMTRMTKDIDEVVRTMTMIGTRVMTTLLVFPITMISLIVIDWRFAIILLGVGALTVPFARQIIRALPAATNAVSVAEAERNAVLLDTLRGLPTMRAFDLGSWAIQRMERTSWRTIHASADRVPWITRLMGQGQIAYGAWMILTLGLGTYLTFNGSITAGEASAAAFLVFRAEVLVFNALFFIGDLQNSATSLGRAVSLAKIYNGDVLPTPEDLTGPVDVVIDNATFTYPHGATIIDGLSVTFKAGTTTALVGTSGAGKSTIASLIAGLLKQDSGSIRIGGVDTSKVTDTWTAKNVTLVSQEVHIFSGTLREDLRMAAPTATDSELLSALAAVGLGEDSPGYIRSFAQGLDTPVGAGAKSLAPEVEQQIALARVVLCQPWVLILDEATAEAGSDSTAVLEEAAKKVTEGKTALVVAHRLDQAMTADRILVIDQGAILEDGSHAELMAAKGRYAQLFNVWSGSGHTDRVEK